MKFFGTFFLLLTSISALWAQPTFGLDWQQLYHSSLADRSYGAFGIELGLDSLGFVYSLGSVEDSIGDYTSTIFVGEAFFITKMDPSGGFVQSHKLAVNQGGYTANSSLYLRPDMAIDPIGNIYVTGYISDSVDVDPDSATTQWIAGQGKDVLTYKLDPNGNLLWARASGGTGNESGRQIALDSHGSAYVIGSFENGFDADPGPGTWMLNSPGNLGVFVQKFDSAGTFLWATSIGNSSGTLTTRAFEISNFDELYISGGFSGSIDFDPGSASLLLDAGINRDMFVMKLDENGDFMWAKAVGDEGSLISEDLTIDPLGNVLTIGTVFIDSIDFDPGPNVELFTFPISVINGYSVVTSSVFLQKLDASGNLVWAKQLIGGGVDESSGEGYGVATDGCGNVYVTGSALWWLTESTKELEQEWDSPENHDGQTFLLKFTENGNLVWNQAIGSFDSDWGHDVRVNEDRKIFLTGVADANNDLRWSTGSYHQAPDSASLDSVINAIACQSYLSPSGASLWTSSGVYFDTIFSCSNSSIQINLTITEESDSALTVAACAPFDLNGLTYNTSGTYTQLLTNQAGCDSTLTLDLSILEASQASLVESACEDFSLNGEIFTSSGTYTQLLTNQAGCDSTLTLDLTIIEASQASLIDSACEEYSLNGETFTSSGTYTQLLSNQAGCDSTLTLELTLLDSLNLGISQSGTILSALATGVSYQWLDCEQNFAPIPGETSQQLQTSGLGSYAVILSNGLCSDTSACLSFSVGLDGSFPTAWQLFPNPSQGLLHLKFDQVYEQVSVRVLTVLGQAISQQEVEVGSQEVEIFLPQQTGLYLIEVSADGQRSVAKVLRE